MVLEKVLESLNSGPLFAFAVFIGAIASVHLMQLSWKHEDQCNPPWIRNLKALSHVAVALSFLWCLSYSEWKAWAPWPPMLALIVMFDVNIIVRIMSIYWKHRHNRISVLTGERSSAGVR